LEARAQKAQKFLVCKMAEMAAIQSLEVQLLTVVVVVVD
jgi:hypothetical protein